MPDQNLTTRSDAWRWLERCTTLITLLASSAVLWWLVSGSGGQPQDYDNRRIQQPVEDVSETTRAPNHGIGSDTAKVILIEFSDFACQFCGRHERETFPSIHRDFVETGMIRYAFRHLPLGGTQYSMAWANAAECAGAQGLFWQARAALFRMAAHKSGDTVVSQPELRGMDEVAFEQCLASAADDPLAQLDIDVAEGRRLKVSATPTFFVGLIQADGRTVELRKRINGALSYRVFASIIRWAERQAT